MTPPPSAAATLEAVPGMPVTVPVRRPDADVRLARVAVSVVFFLVGVGTANWAVRIPDVQQRLGLDAGRLGLALLGVSAGALVAMPLSGRLVARFGSRPVTWLSAFAFAAALALPARAPGFAALVAALVALGLTNGLLDVAMNAQAAAVQQRYLQPIMTRVHALYSAGGLVGAAIGGRIASAGVDVAAHLLGAAVAIALVAGVAAPRMLPASADAVPKRPKGARHAPPLRTLAPLGLVAFCVLFGEGAMANWSAVYLRDALGAGPGLAAAGFAAFSLTMAACRGLGDTLLTRLGPVRLVRLGGAVATTGMALVLAGPHPAVVVAGFGLVGAGLSSIFPITLAAAARTPDAVPSAAIAVVSMCGYSGLLAGPPLIGAVANGLTLRGGLALVLLSSVVIVPLARVARRASAGDAGRVGEAAQAA
jgi:MFS family permease